MPNAKLELDEAAIIPVIAELRDDANSTDYLILGEYLAELTRGPRRSGATLSNAGHPEVALPDGHHRPPPRHLRLHRRAAAVPSLGRLSSPPCNPPSPPLRRPGARARP